jgi:hypothetical protein
MLAIHRAHGTSPDFQSIAPFTRYWPMDLTLVRTNNIYLRFTIFYNLLTEKREFTEADRDNRLTEHYLNILILRTLRMMILDNHQINYEEHPSLKRRVSACLTAVNKYYQV